VCWECRGEVDCWAGGVDAGCELLGEGGGAGDEGEGWLEDLRAGPGSAEEEAEDKEETEEPVRRPAKSC
jgi:hypothetical protein